MSLILLLKLLLVPALIGATSVAGWRWGPAVAGWLSGFPIVTGPILFFLTYENGADFGTQAALGALLGLPAVYGFNLIYSWVATRLSWPLSLAAALATYAGVASTLLLATTPSVLTIALAIVVLCAGARLFPRTSTAAIARPSIGLKLQLALRMLTAALLVAAVTHFAEAIGPRMSGLLAIFPIVSIVLAAFSHHFSGAAFATRLLKSVILGWYALVVFSVILFVLLPHTSLSAAFSAATLGAVAVQLASRRYARR